MIAAWSLNFRLIGSSRTIPPFESVALFFPAPNVQSIGIEAADAHRVAHLVPGVGAGVSLSMMAFIVMGLPQARWMGYSGESFENR